MSKSTKYAMERAIKSVLEWTNEDAELAHQVAMELAALDWKQALLQQKQEEINSQMWSMRNFLEWRKQGGGFCDDCGEINYVGGYRRGPMYNKVYFWPHTVAYYGAPIETSGRRYCWKCFCNMQKETELHFILKYKEKHPELSKTFLQWKHKMHKCTGCGRLFPEIASYSFKSVSGAYCLHCVEKGIENQFTQCQGCNKKIAIATGGICLDCRPFYREFEPQVTAHLMRARGANTPATLTVKQWAQTVTYFEKKCAYCQKHSFKVLEHFLPISLGGGTTADNCVPSCQRCNSKKSNTHPDFLSKAFSLDTVERIKTYLQSTQQEDKPYTITGKELVVIA